MTKLRHYRVFVVRSGDTDWDREGRLAGGSDLPLSDAARGELTATIDRLAGLSAPPPSGARVLSGPDEAAMTTAEAIVERFDGSTKAIDEMHEVGLGLWEGSLRTELEGRCPTAFRKWVDEPWSVTPPEGESLEDAARRLRKRVIKALEKQKAGVEAVVLVLRPMAWSLVAGWLGDRPLDEPRAAADDDGLAVFDVELSDLKGRGLRATATA